MRSREEIIRLAWTLVGAVLGTIAGFALLTVMLQFSPPIALVADNCCPRNLWGQLNWRRLSRINDYYKAPASRPQKIFGSKKEA